MKKADFGRIYCNQAQRAIALSEGAFGESALNVISVRLRLPDCTAEEAKAAADWVLRSADVFSARLCAEGEELYFVSCGTPGSLRQEDIGQADRAEGDREAADCAEEVCGQADRGEGDREAADVAEGACGLENRRQASEHCRITPEMDCEAAEEYTHGKDCSLLQYPGQLYEVEAIPVREGGCVLYARFHHIIMDGYGMSLFAQKTLDALEGKEPERSVFFREDGNGDPETDPGYQRGDGEEGRDAGREAHGAPAEKGFWQEYFSEAQFEPAVFADASEGLGFTRFHRTLSGETAEKIERFGRENGITTPYVLAAAYAVWLAEATGKSDAVFLMPRLNRRGEELKSLGCYTLLVPVRVRVRQDDTFGAVCRRTAEAARLASAHKGYGYENILQAVREQNPGIGSLSEYVFNFYRYELQAGIRFSCGISVAGAMHNHFTWNIFKRDGELVFVFDLRDGVCHRQGAEFFAESILEILEQGMKGLQVSGIPVVGGRERRLLLGVQGEKYTVDDEATIPSLFRKAASEYAERPALYAGEHSYTFAQLDQVSDTIAVALAERGVRSGDSVAFMLKRDIRLIPVMLGIAKAGAAFIPVDPMYPKDRVDYILENSGARRLISSADVEAAREYEYLEAEELATAGGDEWVLPEIRQDQTAYMIYTSGTTGRPKGVMLSHRGIANIVHPGNNPFSRDIIKNCRGIVAIGSICFDISLFEIFVPLFNGLFVELGNERAMVDPEELAEHILRHGADVLHCTPSRIVSYLGNPAFTEALQSVQAVLSAGEVLPESLALRLREQYGIRIYNGYGPTETTIGATITEAGDTKTIGSPIGNMGILLLNGNGKQVPWGCAGEICIYGHGVGIGYKDRPEETASKFIEYDGMRIYRTGDMGRLAGDGRLLYHGRNDRQIKLRGLRIELSEIEKVMGAYEGVAQAACVLRKVDGVDRLAGFYTMQEGCEAGAAELRDFLKERLTSYMVPDILKRLEEMPQTPGGKTDLKALTGIPVEFQRVFRAPAGETEKAICDAFSAVLGIRQIGMEDNFFELGGDSLSAVRLMVELEKTDSVKEAGLDYASLFRYPTPELLAEKLAGRARARGSFPIDRLDYAGVREYLGADASGEAIPGKTAESGSEEAVSGKISAEGKEAASGKIAGGGSGEALQGEGEHRTEGNLGNVLLTGVTGYLGIHIFTELLQHPDCCRKIFCLARPKGRLSAEKRVKSALFYYAESDYAESFGKKWFVIQGDITQPGIFQEEFREPIDTVINSAANVAHFAYGDILEKVNVTGVKNLIEFAVPKGALFCQISTISVGGMAQVSGELRSFSEKDLYVGQEIFNSYIYSKFMAEYALLRAAADRGLAVKLMRVGNLQGRSRDGEFQMNLRTNAFTRQLSSYVKLGAVPEPVYRASVNFSPVDETAHMIVALAGTKERGAFHVYPGEEVAWCRLFDALEKLGHSVRVISEEAFETLLSDCLETEEGREAAEGLLTERPDRRYRYLPVTQEKTEGILKGLGESWRPVTEEYLNRYLSALGGMDLF